MTLAAGAHLDSLHHTLIELEAFIRGGLVGGHVGLCADHSTPYIVTDRSHRDRSVFVISDHDATDGNTIAIMDVRRNHDHLHAWKASRVDDLSIENVFC